MYGHKDTILIEFVLVDLWIDFIIITEDMPKVIETTNPSNGISPKQAAIMTAMQQIQKQYGTGSIMRLGEKSGKMETEVISTGSIALDLALGVGGLPKGRIIEVFGPEASGKSSLSLHFIAEPQKKGGAAAFIDPDLPLNPQTTPK